MSNEVFYLNLSSSFNILSPPWNQITISQIPIPLVSAIPCFSADGSTVYLIGGMSRDQQNSSNFTITQSSVYAFNTNNLQWTTPNINNFNSTFLGRIDMYSVANSYGSCYSFGGSLLNLTTSKNPITYNDINIFDTNAMRWSTLTWSRAPFSRILYNVVFKDNLMFYIGGSGVDFSMNEDL